MIDLPHLRERLPKPLKADPRDRRLESLPRNTLAEQRDLALLTFLLSTGCRVAEALALDRADLRRDRVTVRVVLLTELACSASATTSARAPLVPRSLHRLPTGVKGQQ